MINAELLCRPESNGRRWFGLVVLLLLAGMSPGCSDNAETFLVRGTVSYQGKALERGTVLFNPVDPGSSPSRAAIQPDGTFELRAAPGEHKITVALYTETDPNQDSESPGYVAPKSLLPEKYLSVSRTPLTCSVGEQETVVDLDL